MRALKDSLIRFVSCTTRVEIAYIRDSNLIGQLIRSCLRQGCDYADFDNKLKNYKLYWQSNY